MDSKNGESGTRKQGKPKRMSKTVKEGEWQWEGHRTQNRLVRKMPLDLSVKPRSDVRKFNKL